MKHICFYKRENLEIEHEHILVMLCSAKEHKINKIDPLTSKIIEEYKKAMVHKEYTKNDQREIQQKNNY